METLLEHEALRHYKDIWSDIEVIDTEDVAVSPDRTQDRSAEVSPLAVELSARFHTYADTDSLDCKITPRKPIGTAPPRSKSREFHVRMR